MKAFRTPMAELTSQLFLGGMGCITAENVQSRGITHILNTAEELKDFHYPPDCDLTIKHILMRDSDTENLLEHLDSCIDHIHYVCKGGGVILVHCVAGVSRSASVCMAYLMKYRNMSLRKAYYHIFNKRPCIFPNFGFWRQLVEFELELRGENSVELLPFVLGLVPDIMKKDAEMRIKFAWMDDLCALFGIHTSILVVQIISIYFSTSWENIYNQIANFLTW